MAEIRYLVTSFICVPHMVGSVFEPIRFLLPVCWLCWFVYTWTYMHIFRRIFLSNYWWQKFLPSIVAEKNATKNGHIQNVCSMWIKTKSANRKYESDGPKTLPTIWHTYMKLVTKYQIAVINSCLEKCDEKCALNVKINKSH
jgi:hypothetical protein